MAAITVSSGVTVDSTNNAGAIRQDQLDTNKTIVAYNLNDISDTMKAVVLDVASDVITAGSPATVETTSDDFGNVDIAALSSTKAVIIYLKEPAGNDVIRGCVVDISGSTVTPGTPSTVESDNCTNESSVCALSSTKAVCAFFSSTDSELQARVLSISGTTITPGSPATVTASGAGWRNISIACLSSSKAIVVWVDTSTNQLRGCVLDISGTTITPGSAQNIVGASGVGNSAQKLIIAMSSTAAIAGYGSGDANVIAMSISGTTITAGSGIQLHASYRVSSLIQISSNQVMVAYSNATDTSALITISVSGTTLTSDANEETLSTNILVPTLADYDTNKAIAAYRITSPNDLEGVTATLPSLAKFYQGAGSLSEKFTLPFATVAPGAMTLDKPLGTVVIGARAPAGVVMVQAANPYPTGTATDTGLPTGIAISSVKWI